MRQRKFPHSERFGQDPIESRVIDGVAYYIERGEVNEVTHRNSTSNRISYSQKIPESRALPGVTHLYNTFFFSTNLHLSFYTRNNYITFWTRTKEMYTDVLPELHSLFQDDDEPMNESTWIDQEVCFLYTQPSLTGRPVAMYCDTHPNDILWAGDNAVFDRLLVSGHPLRNPPKVWDAVKKKYKRAKAGIYND